MSADTLQELLIQELKDLYSAEEQIVRALSKLAQAAAVPELDRALVTHLEETRSSIAHFKDLGKHDATGPDTPGCVLNQEQI